MARECRDSHPRQPLRRAVPRRPRLRRAGQRSRRAMQAPWRQVHGPPHRRGSRPKPCGAEGLAPRAGHRGTHVGARRGCAVRKLRVATARDVRRAQREAAAFDRIVARMERSLARLHALEARHGPPPPHLAARWAFAIQTLMASLSIARETRRVLLACGRPPPKSTRPCCGARTRAGTPCMRRVAVVRGTSRRLVRRRCVLHGGASTGPRTPDGRRRSLEALARGRATLAERRAKGGSAATPA